jgi:hypothetical protein
MQFAMQPTQPLLQQKHMQLRDRAFVLHNIVPWPQQDAAVAQREEDAIAMAAVVEEEQQAR